MIELLNVTGFTIEAVELLVYKEANLTFHTMGITICNSEPKELSAKPAEICAASHASLYHFY